jgi:hypothetical protein
MQPSNRCPGLPGVRQEIELFLTASDPCTALIATGEQGMDRRPELSREISNQ